MKTFVEDSALFYQGHIPIVAYLVIEGEINLFKNNKLLSIISPGEVIGVKELLTDTPSRVSGEVIANTILCYLDRSTILAILDEDDSILSDFFQALLDS